MRMNISIEGRQADMPIDTQQRAKRCLNVLKDIGFDIKLSFSERSPEYEDYIPISNSYPYIPIKQRIPELQEAEIIE